MRWPDPAVREVRRYVLPLREGGSLPGIVEADDDGFYVLKMRGAGQGTAALVADWIGGHLAQAIGLAAPRLTLAHLDGDVAMTEGDAEIQRLLRASDGLNLAVDYLPGATGFEAASRPRPRRPAWTYAGAPPRATSESTESAEPAEAPAPASPLVAHPVNELVDVETASRIVWLDALIENIDRTPRNPNLMLWHGVLRPIDHGAALGFHHRWTAGEAPTVDDERARRPFAAVVDHVLLPRAQRIAEIDADAAARIDRGVLEAVVAAMPDDWMGDAAQAAARRAAYVDHLARRLEGPRGFSSHAAAAAAACASHAATAGERAP